PSRARVAGVAARRAKPPGGPPVSSPPVVLGELRPADRLNNSNDLLGPLRSTAMRLDKLVSERFGLSRRGAQAAVRRGQVDLAGQTCFEPGQDVGPETLL